METIIIHPKNDAQKEAILTILNGLDIPFEKEEIDETERLLTNPRMVEKK